MLRNALLATSAVIALAAALPAAAANLVTNGSFENGFTGWTKLNVPGTFPASVIGYNSSASYPTGAFGEPVTPNNAPTNSPDAVGSHAAYFVSDLATNETLKQTIFLAAGVYQIGFSAYLTQNGLNNVGAATFVGSIAGVELANFSAAPPGKTWTTFAGSTTILADGNYDITFVFNTNTVPAKDVVIDQVYVIAGNPPIGVPEPATIALLGAGLLGLGIARRRKAA